LSCPILSLTKLNSGGIFSRGHCGWESQNSRIIFKSPGSLSLQACLLERSFHVSEVSAREG
jgi:hypothetical protein